MKLDETVTYSVMLVISSRSNRMLLINFVTPSRGRQNIAAMNIVW